MKGFQQRVVDEKVELDKRINKLREFISGDVFDSVSIAEQERMNKQLEIMWQYSNILAERIAAF